MAKYSYNGPVTEFGRCIVNNWQGTTYASSESRARNNLAYQFKTQNNRMASSKIDLPGKLSIIF